VRLVKLAFISFVLIFGVLTVISLMIPSQIRISKAINLPNRKEQILPLLSNQDRWPEWHPAFTTQAGRAQIKSIAFQRLKSNDSLVVWNMQPAGRTAILNGFQLHSFPGSDSLALQWYMDFDLPWYPWQKFGSLFYESTYGRMMQEGLSTIKTRVN
jgi:hypothetical protein